MPAMINSAPDIKYCPFCGENLAKSAVAPFHFCPFCGAKLTITLPEAIPTAIESAVQTTVATTADSAPAALSAITPANVTKTSTTEIDYTPYEKVGNHEDIMNSYEQFIKDQQAIGISKEEIRNSAAILMARLKAKIPLKSKPHNMLFSTTTDSNLHKNTTNLLFTIPENSSHYYSLVLKACARRDYLAKKLESILLRGYFAIRLGLDNMPCLIIYKSKVQDMLPIITIFHEEFAAISLIPGEFNINIDLNLLFSPIINKPVNTFDFIKRTPEQLWLGDTIYALATVHALERDGLLVITDQALYFIYQPYTDLTAYDSLCEWFIIPLYRISALNQKDTAEEKILEVIYNNIDNNTNNKIYSSINFSFPQNPISTETSCHYIKKITEKALNERHFEPNIYLFCQHCDYHQQGEANILLKISSCPKCQQTLTARILKNV